MKIFLFCIFYVAVKKFISSWFSLNKLFIKKKLIKEHYITLYKDILLVTRLHIFFTTLLNNSRDLNACLSVLPYFKCQKYLLLSLSIIIEMITYIFLELTQLAINLILEFPLFIQDTNTCSKIQFKFVLSKIVIDCYFMGKNFLL